MGPALAGKKQSLLGRDPPAPIVDEGIDPVAELDELPKETGRIEARPGKHLRPVFHQQRRPVLGQEALGALYDEAFRFLRVELDQPYGCRPGLPAGRRAGRPVSARTGRGCGRRSRSGCVRLRSHRRDAGRAYRERLRAPH
jgi:hypothetical protein